MNPMNGAVAVRTEVLQYIRCGFETSVDEAAFDRLALAAFEYQFAENEPYRRFCERRGATPGTVDHWSRIPVVPTAAFKGAALICGGPEAAEIVFRTSGTSQGRARRGCHYVRDLSLYEAAALPNFRAHLVPEGVRLRVLVLGPDRETASDSSLSWMLDLVRREFGTPASAHFVDQKGLRVEALAATLEASEAGEEPVMMLGTAAAFAHLLETLDERGRRFRLPSGSRIMETGGFKHQAREMPREEFYAWLLDRLGVSEFYCVAEYGMTEMCSQFYENVLRERALGRSPELRYKTVPPWVRTEVVDAETLELLPPGRVGVLRHFDLANLDSVLAVQTDDLGMACDQGFEILGRAAGAELRGCSIAMDQWLTAQR
jgi:hypothetical protein